MFNLKNILLITLSSGLLFASSYGDSSSYDASSNKAVQEYYEQRQKGETTDLQKYMIEAMALIQKYNINPDKDPSTYPKAYIREIERLNKKYNMDKYMDDSYPDEYYAK